MQRVVILGAGESGVGAALLAKAKGYDVFVSDMGVIKDVFSKELLKENIAFESAQHTEDLILNADLIIKSPGIPDKSPVIKLAKEKGIQIISEIEFAYKYSKAKFVAITGSNGKTTTTMLTYHILKSAGLKVGLAGNVGFSLARQVIDENVDWYVLELSSFQLDGMYTFRANVAILLNITPDHLDRYEYKLDNYVQSKYRITQNQTPDDYLITFADDPILESNMDYIKGKAFHLKVSLENRLLNGAYFKDESLYFSVNNHMKHVFSIHKDELALNGKHNYINSMCAVLASLAVNVEESVLEKSLGSFQNVAHRLEEVAVINGVRYINDSKATNVDSVRYALDSFEKPIIWIAGGVDKGNDYSIIEEQVFEKSKAVICLGTDNSKLKEAFGAKTNLLEADSMPKVFRILSEITAKGDIVLLSPACASFDLFKNYEDRGNQFKAEVYAIKNSKPLLSFLAF
jgi:UDP-N-acetylmuramoylalanine--D-glutamate ligase